MGLCIFSGPKWEDDTLNDINEVSIVLNACDMAKKYRIGYEVIDEQPLKQSPCLCKRKT